MTCYCIVIYLLEMIIVIFVNNRIFRMQGNYGQKKDICLVVCVIYFLMSSNFCRWFIYELFCYNMIYSSYLNIYLRIIWMFSNMYLNIIWILCWSEFLLVGYPSSHRPAWIREETLESGNLFSGSWISASVPLYILFKCIFKGFFCLDSASFQKASQAPFFSWCLSWFHCTNHQSRNPLQYHAVHLTRSSPAPTISWLHSRLGLATY